MSKRLTLDDTLGGSCAHCHSGNYYPNSGDLDLCIKCYSKRRAEVAQQRGQLLSLAELNRVSQSTPFIKGRFGSNQVTMVYGKPASFKSFLTLDLALTLGTPTAVEWFGAPIRKHARTLYVTNEGVGGLSKRATAWAKYHDIAKRDIAVKVFTPTTLWNSTTSEPLLDEVTEMAIAFEADLVIFDTLSSLFGGIGENSSEDISIVLNRLSQIRNDHSIGSLVVHHATKADSDNYRGSGAMEGNVDELFVVSRKDTHATIRSRKVKDNEDWALPFGVESVHLGDDEDGESITSLVVVPADGKAPLSTRIKEFLLSNPNAPATASEVHAGLGGGDSLRHVRRTLTDMAKSGAIAIHSQKGGPKGNAQTFLPMESERLL